MVNFGPCANPRKAHAVAGSVRSFSRGDAEKSPRHRSRSPACQRHRRASADEPGEIFDDIFRWLDRVTYDTLNDAAVRVLEMPMPPKRSLNPPPGLLIAS